MKHKPLDQKAETQGGVKRERSNFFTLECLQTASAIKVFQANTLPSFLAVLFRIVNFSQFISFLLDLVPTFVHYNEVLLFQYSTMVPEPAYNFLPGLHYSTLKLPMQIPTLDKDTLV